MFRTLNYDEEMESDHASGFKPVIIAFVLIGLASPVLVPIVFLIGVVFFLIPPVIVVNDTAESKNLVLLFESHDMAALYHMTPVRYFEAGGENGWVKGLDSPVCLFEMERRVPIKSYRLSPQTRWFSDPKDVIANMEDPVRERLRRPEWFWARLQPYHAERTYNLSSLNEPCPVEFFKEDSSQFGTPRSSESFLK